MLTESEIFRVANKIVTFHPRILDYNIEFFVKVIKYNASKETTKEEQSFIARKVVSLIKNGRIK